MDKQHATAEEEAGGYGTPTPEQETAGREARQANRHNEEATSTSEDGRNGSTAVPSADAELDDSNSEGTEPGRSFSSEPKGEATGLPKEESPKDDDGETFDAG
ncbi:hypothetical protein [Arthrobacter sp. MMS18-M83]|uniref:hypothetical protein n=1 Tax=Arthrobacter sp. MMS18-M83 TaxID=2996261 RepID=UPI00227BC540|nr:hypothetical protein [Arthrobacter sp. MMS18-M83]WAH97119.1 hypothetical protein OW521_22695 [Arthrobacter sp. MMS18-M83]